MAGVGEFAGGRPCRVAVDVGEHDRCTGSGERARGVEPHAAGRAGDQGDLAAEVIGRVHRSIPTRVWNSPRSA